jgi:hypothetical protein
MSDISGNGGVASGSSDEQAEGARAGRTWNVNTERLRVTSGELLSKLRELMHEGNVRRVVVRGHDERVLLDIPVTAGAVGVVLAPFAAVFGVLAAMATRCTIEIERIAEEQVSAEPEAGAENGASAPPKTATRKTKD